MTSIPRLAVRTGDSRFPYRDTPQGHMPKASLPNPTELKVKVSSTQIQLFLF